MTGTIRTLDTAMQRTIHERMHRTVTKIAESAGATADLELAYTLAASTAAKAPVSASVTRTRDAERFPRGLMGRKKLSSPPIT